MGFVVRRTARAGVRGHYPTGNSIGTLLDAAPRGPYPPHKRVRSVAHESDPVSGVKRAQGVNFTSVSVFAAEPNNPIAAAAVNNE